MRWRVRKRSWKAWHRIDSCSGCLSYAAGNSYSQLSGFPQSCPVSVIVLLNRRTVAAEPR